MEKKQTKQLTLNRYAVVLLIAIMLLISGVALLISVGDGATSVYASESDVVSITGRDTAGNMIDDAVFTATYSVGFLKVNKVSDNGKYTVATINVVPGATEYKPMSGIYSSAGNTTLGCSVPNVATASELVLDNICVYVARDVLSYDPATKLISGDWSAYEPLLPDDSGWQLPFNYELSSIFVHIGYNANPYTVIGRLAGGTGGSTSAITQYLANPSAYDSINMYRTADFTELFTRLGDNITISVFAFTSGNPSLGANNFGCYSDVLYIGGIPLPPEPTKDGHRFVGWYTDEACTVPYLNDVIYGDTTLYAGWERLAYVVRIEVNGGVAVVDQSILYGDTADIPTVVRVGYDFVGWYSDEACTVEYDWDAPVEADTVVYVKWSAKIYTVTFIVDGEVYATISVYYGSSLVDVAELVGLSASELYADMWLTRLAGDSVVGDMIIYGAPKDMGAMQWLGATVDTAMRVAVSWLAGVWVYLAVIGGAIVLGGCYAIGRRTR